MSSPYANPRFWAGPIRYCRWAARERPAYFWSVVIGALGPVQALTIPKVRRWIGDEDADSIPVTYPERLRQLANMMTYQVPTAPRKQLTGYDD